MTVPTKNSVPSGNILDQVFNAEKIDQVVNSDDPQYSDRFGIKRFTVAGLTALVKNLIGSISGSGGAANVGLAQGGSVQNAVSYVTPEMSGIVTGAGNFNDDTAALQWAFNQNSKTVVLDSNKTYSINPGVVKRTGTVSVEAGTATLVCDGICVEVIDGPGSSWVGGTLKSKTTPWTVVYDKNFTIIESGLLGYGRMPYQDDASVSSDKYYQKTPASWFLDLQATQLSMD